MEGVRRDDAHFATCEFLGFACDVLWVICECLCDSFIVITRNTVSSFRSLEGSTPNSNENSSPLAVDVQDTARKPLEELSANKSLFIHNK